MAFRSLVFVELAEVKFALGAGGLKREKRESADEKISHDVERLTKKSGRASSCALKVCDWRWRGKETTNEHSAENHNRMILTADGHRWTPMDTDFTGGNRGNGEAERWRQKNLRGVRKVREIVVRIMNGNGRWQMADLLCGMGNHNAQQKALRGLPVLWLYLQVKTGGEVIFLPEVGQLWHIA